MPESPINTKQILQPLFQAALTAVVLAVAGVLWSVYNDVQTLKLHQDNLMMSVAKLEADVEQMDDNENDIKLSLITIQTEIPHIRSDIVELSDLIRKMF